MQISFLADRPEFIAVLAPLVAAHWQPIIKEVTPELRAVKFRNHLNVDILPVAWVAHDQNRVFGTVALRVHDLPGHEHLSPWLGGVFTVPDYRRQGVGTALCQTVEKQA